MSWILIISMIVGHRMWALYTAQKTPTRCLRITLGGHLHEETKIIPKLSRNRIRNDLQDLDREVHCYKIEALLQNGCQTSLSNIQSDLVAEDIYNYKSVCPTGRISSIRGECEQDTVKEFTELPNHSLDNCNRMSPGGHLHEETKIIPKLYRSRLRKARSIAIR